MACDMTIITEQQINLYCILSSVWYLYPEKWEIVLIGNINFQIRKIAYVR